MNDPQRSAALRPPPGAQVSRGAGAIGGALLPAISIPAGPLSSEVLFGDARPLHFEIGFGSGEHLAYLPYCSPTMVSSARSPSSTASCALSAMSGHALACPAARRRTSSAQRLPDASLRFVYSSIPIPGLRRVMPAPDENRPLDLIAAKRRPAASSASAPTTRSIAAGAMMGCATPGFRWLIDSARDFCSASRRLAETRYEAKARGWATKCGISAIEVSHETPAYSLLMLIGARCCRPVRASVTERSGRDAPSGDRYRVPGPTRARPNGAVAAPISPGRALMILNAVRRREDAPVG